MPSKKQVCRQEGGRSWIEDQEPNPVGLEFNPSLFHADNKDDNMAADTFAPGMVLFSAPPWAYRLRLRVLRPLSQDGQAQVPTMLSGKL